MAEQVRVDEVVTNIMYGLAQVIAEAQKTEQERMNEAKALNVKECKKLHLCYNRKRGNLDSFTVQLSTLKGWGIIKMYYVPEEEDIQNVLQTVFENY